MLGGGGQTKEGVRSEMWTSMHVRERLWGEWGGEENQFTVIYTGDLRHPSFREERREEKKRGEERRARINKMSGQIRGKTRERGKR